MKSAKRKHGSSAAAWLGFGLGILLFATLSEFKLLGQGTTDPPGLVVLRTGSGMPLTSSVRQLQVDGGGSPQVLSFEFGFGTDEPPAPGEFLDSFSITLQDHAAVNTLLVLSADANGVLWAPLTSGGVTLSPDAITNSVIIFPSLQPTPIFQIAYAVQVELPAVFSGSVNVFFDLFDNLNTTASFGWYRDSVNVPEPQPWEMLGAVGVLGWLLRRTKH